MFQLFPYECMEMSLVEMSLILLQGVIMEVSCIQTRGSSSPICGFEVMWS